jgi:hypothetical protein
VNDDAALFTNKMYLSFAIIFVHTFPNLGALLLRETLVSRYHQFTKLIRAELEDQGIEFRDVETSVADAVNRLRELESPRAKV